MPGLRAGRQMPERGADAVVGAVEVGADEVVEPVSALLVLAVGAPDPARSDERMDRPERVGGARECELDRPRISDVARLDAHVAVDLGRGLLEARLIARDERDARHRPAPRAARSRARSPFLHPSRPRACRSSVLHSFAICGLSVVRSPCTGRPRQRRLPLRRARDATRTKLSRRAVRGSGRSVGEVDESAPGSANPWSLFDIEHAHRDASVFGL